MEQDDSTHLTQAKIFFKGTDNAQDFPAVLKEILDECDCVSDKHGIYIKAIGVMSHIPHNFALAFDEFFVLAPTDSARGHIFGAINDLIKRRVLEEDYKTALSSIMKENRIDIKCKSNAQCGFKSNCPHI